MALKRNEMTSKGKARHSLSKGREKHVRDRHSSAKARYGAELIGERIAKRIYERQRNCLEKKTKAKEKN